MCKEIEQDFLKVLLSKFGGETSLPLVTTPESSMSHDIKKTEKKKRICWSVTEIGAVHSWKENYVTILKNNTQSWKSNQRG